MESFEELRHIVSEMADERAVIPLSAIADIWFSIRDLRLETNRLKPEILSDSQRHHLRLLESRLEAVLEGNAHISSIPSEAKRTLEAFGWANN